MEAALFQWLNPKALTLAVGVITAFTTPGPQFWTQLSGSSPCSRSSR